MSRESKYPEELFAGSPDTLEALKARITARSAARRSEPWRR
jgi:hypothetical protein